MIVKYPGKARTGFSEQTVQNIDIMPELLRYLELKNLRLAVISHGGPAFVNRLLKNLPPVTNINFYPSINRLDFMLKLPGVNAVELAAQKLKLRACNFNWI